MNLKNTLNLSIFLLILLFGCQNTNQTLANYSQINLLKYGVPLEIMAPDNVSITTDDFIAIKEVSIKKGNDYFIQILYSDTQSNNLEKIKVEEISNVKNDKFFKKILTEDPNGFIYQNQIDSTTISYGFRHIVLQGNKEYIFRNGILGIFTLDQINIMYNSAKTAK